MKISGDFSGSRIKDFPSLSPVSICFNGSRSYRDQQFPDCNLWIAPENCIKQQNLLAHRLHTALLSYLWETENTDSGCAVTFMMA